MKVFIVDPNKKIDVFADNWKQEKEVLDLLDSIHDKTLLRGVQWIRITNGNIITQQYNRSLIKHLKTKL